MSAVPMHGPTRVEFSAATNLAYCTECPWRAQSPTPERVRQAARQHAALEHKDKRARWAYDQANHRARIGGAA